MTIDVDDFDRLRKRVDQLKSERDRARGALDGLRKRLKEEFGCDTSDEAREKLKRMQVRRDKLEKRFAAELAKFEESWGERLVD